MNLEIHTNLQKSTVRINNVIKKNKKIKKWTFLCELYVDVMDTNAVQKDSTCGLKPGECRKNLDSFSVVLKAYDRTDVCYHKSWSI